MALLPQNPTSAHSWMERVDNNKCRKAIYFRLASIALAFSSTMGRRRQASRTLHWSTRLQSQPTQCSTRKDLSRKLTILLTTKCLSTSKEISHALGLIRLSSPTKRTLLNSQSNRNSTKLLVSSILISSSCLKTHQMSRPLSGTSQSTESSSSQNITRRRGCWRS